MLGKTTSLKSQVTRIKLVKVQANINKHKNKKKTLETQMQECCFLTKNRNFSGFLFT